MTDLFRKAFLEGYAGSDVSVFSVISALVVTVVIGLYIFLIYRVLTRKAFYSRNFNVSLVGVALITSAIIVTVQSSVVVSLGMVGALSIIRFRTAVKDPLDLTFLFWAVSVGIICGAGFAIYAVVLSIVLTVTVFLLNCLPSAAAPMILIVNTSIPGSENTLLDVVRKYAKHPQVKSRNMTVNSLDLTIELRTERGSELIQELTKEAGVVSASLLSQNGEVTF